MSNYIEQINKLASVIGCPVNFIDQVPIKILNDEIANLTSSNAAKRKAVDLIKDETEKMKVHIASMRDEELCIEEEITGCHRRTNILKEYIQTIESSDAFLPNKVIREVEAHISSIYDPMMEIHERRSEIMKQLDSLRELQNDCDKLRKQIDE